MTRLWFFFGLLVLFSCNVSCEQRPKSVPRGAIYTGTWKADAEWIDCADLSVGKLVACRIYSKLGSELERGEFLVDSDPSRFVCDYRKSHCAEFISAGPATFLNHAYIPKPPRYLIRIKSYSNYFQVIGWEWIWNIVNPECLPAFQAFDYPAIRDKGVEIRSKISIPDLLLAFVSSADPALPEGPIEVERTGSLSEEIVPVGEINEAGLSVQFKKGQQRYQAVMLDGCMAEFWRL